jgi:hypothetical protein
MAPTEFHEALGALGIAQQRVAALFGVAPRSVRRWQHGKRRVPCGVGIVLRLLAAGAVTVDQVEQAAAPLSARTNGGAKSEPPVVEPPSERTLVEPALERFVLAGAEAVTLADSDLPLSARTNGGAKPEPPAPLYLEPTSEASTNFAESAPESSAPLPLEPAPEQSATIVESPEPSVAEPSAILADPVTTAEKVAALTPAVCRWPCGDPLHSDFRFCGSPVTAPPYCEEHRAAAYLVPPPLWLRRRRRSTRGIAYTSARGIAWAG